MDRPFLSLREKRFKKEKSKTKVKVVCQNEDLVLPRESCKLALTSHHQTPYMHFQRRYCCQRNNLINTKQDLMAG